MKDNRPIANHLTAHRQKRGFSAADLAQHAGISRQTVYAIESGSYVPNTAVALRLARTLEVNVEDLFALPSDAPAAPLPILGYCPGKPSAKQADSKRCTGKCCPR